MHGRSQPSHRPKFAIVPSTCGPHVPPQLAATRTCLPLLLHFTLQILWEQAQRGEQPGLMLMQDALSGENKAQTWGNEPTIMEPEDQN